MTKMWVSQKYCDDIFLNGKTAHSKMIQGDIMETATDLGWHDFSIRPSNLDPSVHARPVVRLHDVPAIDLIRANPAVVWSLRTREPILGPPEGVLVLVQEAVLLLNAEPWVLLFGFHHGSQARFSLVGICIRKTN